MNIINGDLYVIEDVVAYATVEKDDFEKDDFEKDDFLIEGDLRVYGKVYLGPHDSPNIKGKLYCTGDIIAEDFIIGAKSKFVPAAVHTAIKKITKKHKK